MTLKPENLSFEIIAGKSVLESAEIAGIKLPFGCRAGACGACFIRILQGIEHLAPPSEVEKDTLQKIRLAGEGRLACRSTKISGNMIIQRR